jgi:hypothetical protein
MIAIGNVRITPASTREDPYLFEDLVDAAAFSRMTGCVIWAICSFDPNLYQVFPGGRTETHLRPSSYQRQS